MKKVLVTSHRSKFYNQELNVAKETDDSVYVELPSGRKIWYSKKSVEFINDETSSNTEEVLEKDDLDTFKETIKTIKRWYKDIILRINNW